MKNRHALVGSAGGQVLAESKKALKLDGRPLRGSDRIYDLVDVVGEDPVKILQDECVNEGVEKKIFEIAEKVAREMFPQIAERIIREEIERLKEQD